MYSISNVKTEDLSKIEVKNQPKIIQLIGKKLNPVEAFEVIKKDSGGFTKSHKKAEEADRLLADLLKKNGIKVIGTPKKSTNNIRLKEQERARSLDLLELELKLAA